MNSEEIREYYDRIAPDYENLVNRLVPYYSRQNSVLMDLVPFERRAEFRVLDLGSGPGILSRLLLDTFPNAQVTAFDLSQGMLDVCRKRLWAYPARARFVRGNLTQDDIGAGYDVIFAGLVLHHLTDADKRSFFKRAAARMKPGAVLLCRDMVLGATPRLTEEYDRFWKLYMRAQGENGSLWYARLQAQSLRATVESMLSWLRDAGFQDVDCHWRHLDFAITGGRKPAERDSI